MSSSFFRDAHGGADPRERARLDHERFLLDTYADRRAGEPTLRERLRALVTGFVAR